jgi:hypothetical protein
MRKIINGNTVRIPELTIWLASSEAAEIGGAKHYNTSKLD